MGWGCYKHEWDAGSDNWQAYAKRLCTERLDKTQRADWGRDCEICPKCFEEMETEATETTRQRDLLLAACRAGVFAFTQCDSTKAQKLAALASMGEAIVECKGEGQT